MNRLYEVIIGQKAGIGTAAVDAKPATETTPAVLAQPATPGKPELYRVELKNVVAHDVEEVIGKLKPALGADQFIASVTFLSDVHA